MDPETGPAPNEGFRPAGLALSAFTTVLLVVTGWYGGELVYRHRISVTGHGGSPSSPDQE